MLAVLLETTSREDDLAITDNILVTELLVESLRDVQKGSFARGIKDIEATRCEARRRNIAFERRN